MVNLIFHYNFPISQMRNWDLKKLTQLLIFVPSMLTLEVRELDSYSQASLSEEHYYSVCSEWAHSCLNKLQLSPIPCTGILCSLPLPESFLESIWEYIMWKTPVQPRISSPHSRHRGQWSVLGISLKVKQEFERRFCSSHYPWLACRISDMF